MGWRTVTEADLLAALSRDEVEAVCRDFEGDPLADQLRQTVAFVRGCVRTGARARLSPDEGALPESLVQPAMAYLRLSLLSRLGAEPTDARRRAYEDAVALFERVRQGEFVPEPGEEGAGDAPRAVAAAPATGRPNPDKRLLD